jgi:predicted PurR-regulated permease PerM
MAKNLTKPFLLILVSLVLVGCFFIFRPFLTEIFVAAILVSIFYTPFSRLSAFLKGRRHLAALIMCLLLLVVIILPSMRLLVYAGQKSVVAYSSAVEFFGNRSMDDVLKSDFFQRGALRYLDLKAINLDNEAFKSTMLEVFKQSSNWLISGATFALRETTNFVISLLMIVLAMFFFFVDGKSMMERLMRLSPLPDKYDREIFNKFRAVSYATFLSTFVAALGQGVIAAIGFFVIGFPPFFAGLLVSLLSLLPYLGSAIFYVPVGLYYLVIGEIWQGVFILLWGMFIISTVDNLIRTYMIKGEAEINPIFILFSILGGIFLFGFWGVLLGPLVLALTVTIFHIYELEFCDPIEEEVKD